jgi:hypothetical protein
MKERSLSESWPVSLASFFKNKPFLLMIRALAVLG